MKRILLFFALATLLASCNINSVDNTNMKTLNLSVSAQEWIPHIDNNEQNLYYYHTFPLAQITPLIYDEGLVQVYLYRNGGQQMLPYVQHYENVDGARWTRTIDYDYAEGDLTVYVTSSDFFNEIPEQMFFRVVLMW